MRRAAADRAAGRGARLKGNLTAGEAAALTVGAGAGWAAAALGAPVPAAVLTAWVVLAALESFVGPVPDAPPAVTTASDHLEVRFPHRPRLGDLAVVLGALALALGLVRAVEPPLADAIGSTAGVAGSGVLFLGTLVGVSNAPIDPWNQRFVTLRLDGASRRLTIRGTATAQPTLLLGEIAAIRAHLGALRITHTDGDLVLPMPGVDLQVLDNVAAELDAFARRFGADPEAPALRRKAMAALAATQRE